MNWTPIWILSAFSAVAAISSNSWLDTVLPVNERVVTDQFFEPLHTYTFLYDAQVATGIPGASKQHSGTRIQCLAELIFSSQTSCRLQLSHVRFGRMNREIPEPRQIIPFEAFEEVPLHKDVERSLAVPVGFTYKDGIVADVTFDGEESPWSSNVIRGVLNMIQVTLNSEYQVHTEARRLVNVVNPNDPLLRSQAKQYRVQEKTLEGDCETIYTVFNVSTLEQLDKLVILKSLDFDKCKMRPEIRYNFRFADPCPYYRNSSGKSKNEFFKTSTLARYHVRAGRAGSWLLENVQYEGEHIFSPYDPSAGVAVSYLNQTLTLLKSSNSTSTIRHMGRPIISQWGLVYALDWDIWKERFAMDGKEEGQLHFLRRMPYSDVKQEKRALIPGLMRALLEKMRSMEDMLNEEAPRHLMRLVFAFRLLTKLELDDVYRELTAADEGAWSNEQRKIIKDILPHAVAMCSTKECIAHLVEKIKNGDVPPKKAAASLKCLMNDRSISADEIEMLLTLADVDVVSQNFLVRQGLWLTIGSMINGLCMPNEDVLAREYREDVNTFCTRQLKENYVEVLFNKFSSAEKWVDQVLFMKAIGNAGLDLSVFNLERIIRLADGQAYTNKIRTEAILALRQLKSIMPRKIQKILLPILCNQAEAPGVRISAAYQLLQTMPERAILDQIARMLYTDTSKQVASFISNYMHTLARSTNPCEQRLVGDLKLALRHAQVDGIDKPGLSYMRYYDIYNRMYHSGVEMEVASIFANNSFLPKYFKTTFHTNAMGFWHKYFFTLGFVQDGLEPMVRDWIFGRKNGANTGQAQEAENESESRVRRVVESAVSNMQNELNELFRKLGIRAHTDPDPKAFAYMKFLDQDYAMLPFILTEEQRGTQATSGMIDVKKIIADLRSGISINVNEADLLAEITYKIPTILGLPLVWTIRIPMMYSVVGRLQSITAPENGDWQSLKITANLKSSFVVAVITEMEAWSPVVNSGLRILSKAKVHAPIDIRFEIDRSADPTTTKLSFKLPTGKKELLSLETRPITITRIWPPRPLKTWNEPDSVSIISEDSRKITKVKHCFGRNLFGIEICARGQYTQSSDLSKQTPRCPLIGPEKILITSESIGDQSAVEISIKLATKFYERPNITIQPSFSKWTDFPNDKPASDSQQPPAPDRQYQIRDPWKHTAKLEVDGKGRRLFTADLVHHYDQNHLYQNAEWKFESSLLPQSRICLKSEVLYPSPPYTIDDMKKIDSKRVNSISRITWGGRECDEANYISVQMQAHQPKSHYDVHRRDIDHIILEQCTDTHRMSNCSPIMHYPHLLKSTDLTKYRFLIEQKNVSPLIANFTRKLYESLKHRFFLHSDTDCLGAGNFRNNVYADLELDKYGKRHGDLIIMSPMENVRFTDIPISRLFPVLNLKNRHVSLLLDRMAGDGNRGYCHISRRKITTFDGVEYATPLTTCFHVMSKDCSSSQPKFVVMMRRISDDLKMEVKIITTTHKVIMNLKPDGSVEIDINGKKYGPKSDQFQELTGDHGQILIRIVEMGPYVKLEFPETKLHVYFDGYALNIKLSRLYAGQQCGLCGNFNNEPLDEFRNPNFDIQDDVGQFFTSWTLNEPTGCTMPEAQSVCSEGRCRYRPFQDTDDNLDPERVELQERPLKKTRTLEINSHICFSTEPIDQCRLRTYPVEKDTRQVQFACYDREDEEAESMLARLRTEDTIAVNKEATGIRNLDIPIRCGPLS